MPIKVTYQNPGLECDENMVCEDFLNMGMLPLEGCEPNWIRKKNCVYSRCHGSVSLKIRRPMAHQTSNGSFPRKMAHPLVQFQPSG